MAIICDKCNKKIKSIGLWSSTAKIEVKVVRQISNFTLKTYDLCDKCQDLFKEYIGNFRKKDE